MAPDKVPLFPYGCDGCTPRKTWCHALRGRLEGLLFWSERGSPFSQEFGWEPWGRGLESFELLVDSLGES